MVGFEEIISHAHIDHAAHCIIFFTNEVGRRRVTDTNKYLFLHTEVGIHSVMNPSH